MVDMRGAQRLPGGGVITECRSNLKLKCRLCVDDGIKARTIQRQVEADDFYTVGAHGMVRPAAIGDDVDSGT